MGKQNTSGRAVPASSRRYSPEFKRDAVALLHSSPLWGPDRGERRHPDRLGQRAGRGEHHRGPQAAAERPSEKRPLNCANGSKSSSKRSRSSSASRRTGSRREDSEAPRVLCPRLRRLEGRGRDRPAPGGIV